MTVRCANCRHDHASAGDDCSKAPRCGCTAADYRAPAGRAPKLTDKAMRGLEWVEPAVTAAYEADQAASSPRLRGERRDEVLSTLRYLRELLDHRSRREQQRTKRR
jgi:hypothetical protein